MRRLAPASAMILLLACGAGRAADWSFDPVLTVSQQRNGNVALTAGGAEADDVTVVEVRLPVRAVTERTEVEVAYTPSRETYRAYDQLDNTTQLIAFVWAHQANERVRWDAAVDWERAERLRLGFDNLGRDAPALPRVPTTNVRGRLGARWASSPRGAWSARLEWDATSYGAEPTPDGTNLDLLRLDDATEYEIGFGREQALSPRSRVSLEYLGSRVDEGFRGTSVVHRGLTRLLLGEAERLLATLTVGAARLSADADESIGSERDQSEVIGGLTLRRRAGRGHELSVGVNRDFGGSGGTVGATLTQGAYGAWRVALGRYSALTLLARTSRLTSVGQEAPGAPRTTTRGWRGEWAAALGPRWFVVLSGEAVDQSGRGAGLPALEYTVWGVGVRWAPTARMR